jgi:hypothetical protein
MSVVGLESDRTLRWLKRRLDDGCNIRFTVEFAFAYVCFLLTHLALFMLAQCGTDKHRSCIPCARSHFHICQQEDSVTIEIP